MAELVDALVSGTSDRKVVQVRVLFWAPFNVAVSGYGVPGLKCRTENIEKRI